MPTPAQGSYKTCDSKNFAGQVAYEECLIAWDRVDMQPLTHSWMASLIHITPAEPVVMFNEHESRVVLVNCCIGKRMLLAWPMCVVPSLARETEFALLHPIKKQLKIIITKIGREPDAWKILPVEAVLRGVSQDSRPQVIATVFVGVVLAFVVITSVIVA